MIRLLARGTVEEGVVAEQRRRMNLGGAAPGADATMADVDPGTLLAVLRGHINLTGEGAEDSGVFDGADEGAVLVPLASQE